MKLNLHRIFRVSTGIAGLSSGLEDMARQVARSIDEIFGIELTDEDQYTVGYHRRMKEFREKNQRGRQELHFISDTKDDFYILEAGISAVGFVPEARVNHYVPRAWLGYRGEFGHQEISWKEICERENKIEWFDQSATASDGVENCWDLLVSMIFRRDDYDSLNKSWNKLQSKVERMFQSYLGRDTAIWMVGSKDLQSTNHSGSSVYLGEFRLTMKELRQHEA